MDATAKKIAKLLFPTVIAIGLVALFYVMTSPNPVSIENIGQIYRGQENLVLSNKITRKMIFENDMKWDEIEEISFKSGKSYGGKTGNIYWSVPAAATLKSGEVRTANLMTDFKPTVEKVTHNATIREWKVYTNGREIEQTIEEAVNDAHSLVIDGMTQALGKSREEKTEELRTEWQKASDKLAVESLK